MKHLFCILLCCIVAVGASAQRVPFMSLSQEDGLQDNSISCIFMDSLHLVYFGSYRGIDRFDGMKIINVPFPNGNEDEANKVTAIVAEDAANLLVGNGSGLWRLSKREMRLIRIFQKEIDCKVTAITKVRGGLLVATEFGNWLLRAGKIKKVARGKTPNSSLLTPHSSLYSGWGRFKESLVTYRSPDGVEWVGYNFFGVDYTYYNRHIFKIFSIGDFDSRGVQVRSFLRDGSRTLLGTRDGLYVVDAHGSKYIDGSTLGANIVTQIVRHGGEYLVATIGGGVKKVDAKSLRVTGTLLADANVYLIKTDGDGNVWLCSSKGISVCGKTPDKVRTFNTRNSQLPSDEVFCVGFDNGGNGWISTNKGLCRFLKKDGYLTTDGISSKVKDLGTLRSIDRLSSTELMLIPQHGNARIYNVASDAMRTVDINAGMPDAAFLFVKVLGKNKVVFVTAEGIYYSDGGKVRRFGYIDGLDNLQFQSNNVSVDANGVLWAATNSGLAYASLKDIANHRYAHHEIILNEIQTDHWFSQPEVSEVMLTHSVRTSRIRNDLSFQFTPLIYGNMRGVLYRYKMSGGRDTTWTVADHDHTITFRDLPFGSYDLRIEAVGMPEVSTTLHIDVLLTYNAIALVCIAIIALAFAGYVIYCKKTKTEYFWKRFVPKPEKYQKSHLDSKTARKLQKDVVKYLDEKKPYLKADFQMSDLAKAIGCTQHELSQVFSQYMQRNYYDVIAEYRIKEFKRLAADPAYSKYTITALSELCGFRSRTPFLTAFKKFTGMTPKEFMKDRG